jgi:hypothetical protein
MISGVGRGHRSVTSACLDIARVEASARMQSSTKVSLLTVSIAASLLGGLGCDDADKNTPAATEKDGNPNDRKPDPALGDAKAETKAPAAAGVKPAHAVDGAPADGAMGGGQADVAETKAKPGDGAGTPGNQGDAAGQAAAGGAGNTAGAPPAQ